MKKEEIIDKLEVLIEILENESTILFEDETNFSWEREINKLYDDLFIGSGTYRVNLELVIFNKDWEKIEDFSTLKKNMII